MLISLYSPRITIDIVGLFVNCYFQNSKRVIKLSKDCCFQNSRNAASTKLKIEAGVYWYSYIAQKLLVILLNFTWIIIFQKAKEVAITKWKTVTGIG